jgi:hypothetical protein
MPDQSGQADKGQTPDMATRLKTLARCIIINKHKAMASEYIAEQKAEQEAQQKPHRRSLTITNWLPKTTKHADVFGDN